MSFSRNHRRPLWRRILGPEFDLLPTAVRAMFDHNGHRYARGTAVVEGGDSLLARLCIALSGFPKPGTDIPVSILFQAEGDADIWHRTFGDRRFASVHLGRDGTLLERFGALTFVFRLCGSREGVVFEMVETRLLGLRLPRTISPSIAATQMEENGRFRFEIVVDLPGGRRMVRMVGLLGSTWPSRSETAAKRPAVGSGLPGRSLKPVLALGGR